MRTSPTIVLTALVAIVLACGHAPVEPGWVGADVHLVDGTWIGTEVDCTNGDLEPFASLAPSSSHGDQDLEWHMIVGRALSALEPSVLDGVARVVLATLPRRYVASDGTVRTARVGAGIMTRKAVVIDRTDGSRQVIGLWCYLPYDGSSGLLVVPNVECSVDPLDDWRDGTVPPGAGHS